MRLRLTALAAIAAFAACDHIDDADELPRVAPRVAKADAPEPGMTSAGEAIVGFRPGLMPLLTVGGLLGGYDVLRVVRAGDFAVVAADDLGELVKDLVGIAGVAYVEDNAILDASLVPNDTYYDRQYGPRLMGVEAAWDTTRGAASVIVAVLDSGLHEEHADFAATRIGDGYDYVNRDGTPDDRCGHGTHVAGTIGATIANARGVAGVAQVTILPHKVLDLQPDGDCSGDTAGIAEAIYAARDAGAAVINLSLGASSGTTTLKNAVDNAWSRGIFVVAAAGNDDHGPVGYPAAYDSVIAVSAVDSTKALASYSNIGAQVDIAAPGSDVLSTWNDGGYAWASGTSMATPHVAGVLGLARSCAATLAAATLRDKLYQTAEDLGSAGRDNNFGWGLARADRLVQSACTATPPPSSNVLENGRAVSFSVAAKEARAFTLNVPAGTSRLDVVMTGTQNDADLYVRRGAAPDDATWDCRPYLDGSNESCGFANPAAGTWYVSVKGYTGPASVTLTATWSTAGTPASPIVIGALPYHHDGTTVGGSDAWSAYGCSTASEAGPEVVYKVTTTARGTLTATISDGTSVDVDVHLLRAADPNACIARHDTSASALLDAGTYWIAIDTYGSGTGEKPGVYALDVTFSAATTTPPSGDPDPAATTLANGQQVAATIAAGKELFYKISVPTGATNLVVVTDGPSCGLFGCSAATDLYVRKGARPTDSAYDCRPGTSGSDETCTFASPAAAWWFVRVKGVSGTTSLTIKASFTAPGGPAPGPGAPPAGVTVLNDGQAVTVQLASGAGAHYAVWVPAGKSALDVLADGPACGLFGCSFDADLFVRKGAKATTTTHDCASESNSADESCSVSAPASAWWYVLVQAYSGSGSLSLKASTR